MSLHVVRTSSDQSSILLKAAWKRGSKKVVAHVCGWAKVPLCPTRAEHRNKPCRLPCLAHCKLGRAPLPIYPFHGLYCAIWVHPTRALHHSNHKETVPETARADTSAARLPQRVEVEQPKQRSQQRCLRHLRQNRQTVKTVKTSTRYRARVTGPVQYQGLLESTRHRLFYVQNKGRLSS